jgi:hypothetical protein
VKFLVLNLFVFISLTALSQYGVKSIGIHIGGLKFQMPKYHTSEIFSEEYGQISVENKIHLSRYTDLGLFARFQKNKYFVEGVINFETAFYRINKAGAFTTGLKESKVFVAYRPIQIGLYSGIRLYGKKAINIFWRYGIAYDITTLGTNVNILNYLIDATLGRNKAATEVYGDPILINAKDYSIPRISLKTGPEFRFSNSMLSILAQYRSGFYIENKNNKLLNNIISIHLQYSFFLTKRIISNE